MANSNKPFRPLLAGTIDNDEQLEKLAFPLIISPKVDGIRVLCHPELGPVTRSLKPVPNRYVRERLSYPIFAGLDGEICVGPISAKDVMNRTTAIMAYGGEPDFTYNVFDCFLYPERPYHERLQMAKDIVGGMAFDTRKICKVLPSKEIEGAAEIAVYEEIWLKQGFEGVMLRRYDGPYKIGSRSTLKEQILLKLKRFTDAEATVIGFEPLERNTNAIEVNLLGLSERSSANAGKVKADLLGTLRVQSDAFGEFGIGSGFDADLRVRIWRNQDHYLGATVTFKYQAVGVVDKPRFPIFLRFREQE